MASNLTKYKANLKGNLRVFYKQFVAAPIGLKAFTIFAVVVTILQLSNLFSVIQDIRSFYFGKFGVLTNNSYMSALIFTVFLIFATKGIRPFGLRFAIATFLLLAISLHCLKLLNIIDDGGKFEKSGSVGLIWSIIIPAIWVIVIFSPSVSRYCSNKLKVQNQV
jgi:hypothetical protein